MIQNNLNVDDIYIGNTIEYKNEKLLLIEATTSITTSVEDDNIDKFTIVTGTQRWLVEIQPESNFDTPFKTHRNIEFEYCEYSELEDIDGVAEDFNIEIERGEKMQADDFMGCF